MNYFGKTETFVYYNNYEELLDYIEIKIHNINKENLCNNYWYYLLTVGFDYSFIQDDKEYLINKYKYNYIDGFMRKEENEKIKSDTYIFEDNKVIMPIFPKSFLEVQTYFKSPLTYKIKLYLEFCNVDDILIKSNLIQDISNAKLEYKFCNYPNKLNRVKIKDY